MPGSKALSAAGVLAVALLLLLPPQEVASQPLQAPQGLIRIAGGRFVDDACREYRFHGWNGWRTLHYAVNDRAFLTDKFKAAQEAGLNVMRFFLADDDNGPVLQTAPGVFDERSARAVDWLLAEAAAHGIRLTPVLLNTWKRNNGIPLFEEWCGTGSSRTQPQPDIDPRGGLSAEDRLVTPYDWLTSDKCRQQVKDYFSALVSRRNTVTGVLYKDDPTILSWNLLNEPRCMYCGPEPIADWYRDMAAHLKSVDPNHLVSTGAEGFWDQSDPRAGTNPAGRGSWSSFTGQDFVKNNAVPGIDYTVIHMWPDNWRAVDLGFGRAWIEAHAAAAAQLGKPLVLEEFGKEAADGSISSTRDPWYEMVHGEVEDSLDSGGTLRGALFWQWDAEGWRRPSPSSVFQKDSTFQNLIAPFAKEVTAGGSAVVPGCVPRSSAAITNRTQPEVQSFSGAGRKLRARHS